MERSNQIRIRVVGGLLVIGTLLYLALPFLAYRWMQLPSVGFFIDPNMVVSDSGFEDWPSKQLSPPIVFPQRLLAVDGVEVTTIGELNQFLATRIAGEEVTLTLEWPEDSLRAGDDATRQVSYPLGAITAYEMLALFWPFFLTGLLLIVVGLWTFRARPESEAARLFALFTLAGGWAVGGLFEANTTGVFVRLWVTAVCVVGVLHAWFAAVFPYEIRYLRRWPRVRWLLLIPATVVWLWVQAWLYRSSDPWAYVISWQAAYILNGVTFLLALGLIAYRAFQSTSPLVQQQARLILLGALVSTGPLIAWFLTFSFPVRLALVPVVLYPLTVGYTIIRYRLLDVNFVLRRSVTYTLLFVGYTAVVIIASLLLGSVLSPNNPLVLILIVLTVTLTFDVGRSRFQSLVDRYFFRGPVSREELLRDYNRRLTSALDVEQVAGSMIEHAEKGVPHTDVRLYLSDSQESGAYRSYQNGSDPVVDRTSPLVEYFRQEPGAIYLAEEHSWPPELRPFRKQVQELNAAVVVPLLNHERLLGWLSLAGKENGREFDEKDLSYLNSLADQSLLALERVDGIRRLEAQVAELHALSQFSQALNYIIDFDMLLELVYTHCQRLLNISDFYIGLRDPDTGAVYQAFYLESEQRLTGREGRQQAVRDERIVQVIETGQMAQGEDIDNYAWICAPLNAGAEALGALLARRSQPGEPFRERQQQLFSVLADRTATALDRWLANEELQARAQQLQTLNEVTRSLTTTLELEPLLDLILEKAMELLDTEAGSILMVDEDTGDLVFRVVKGPAGQELEGTRLPIGTGLAGTVAQTGLPLVVNDVQHDRRWFEGIDASTDFITRSSLTMPLLRQQQVIGVLQVFNKQSGAPFDEDDQTLLAAFGGQAVVAVETARLLQQTDRALQVRVNELSLLQQLDRDLTTTLELGQVAEITLNWALRLCEGTAGALVLVDENDEAMIRTVRGYDESFEPETVTSETIAAGLTGQVLRTGQTLNSGNVQLEPTYIAAAFKTNSQMTIPIVFRQRTIGAIALESDQYHAFSNADVERAVRLANHAGAAIANALLYEQVIAANDAKSEFVSMVSHELKTPMTAIRGYTDLMLAGMTGEVNERQREFLQTIARNITNTNRLIQDLTDVSRIETGQLHVAPEPITFANVVSEAVQTVEGLFAEKEIALQVDLPVDLPAVLGDYHRLVQVMTNLLSNACKYSPAGTEVQVTVLDAVPEAEEYEREGHVMYCRVRDQGYGMSLEDQQKLFTKFFRSANPEIRKAPGTGLGLSITRGIIELHNGQLWFDSALNEGTTFYFTIPLTEA